MVLQLEKNDQEDLIPRQKDVRENTFDFLAGAGSDFNMNNFNIISLKDPVSTQDAATKNYVDSNSTYWEIDGTDLQMKSAKPLDMQSQSIKNGGDATLQNITANKIVAASALSELHSLQMSGNITLEGNDLTNVNDISATNFISSEGDDEELSISGGAMVINIKNVSAGGAVLAGEIMTITSSGDGSFPPEAEESSANDKDIAGVTQESIDDTAIGKMAISGKAYVRIDSSGCSKGDWLRTGSTAAAATADSTKDTTKLGQYIGIALESDSGGLALTLLRIGGN